MAFESFADFLAMGRHGPYVWAAYGVTFAIVIWNVLQPLLQRKKLLKEQAGSLRREARDQQP
ncbi:MAG: heme exporter protein CcmD [Moraxellaceae bacterium]